MQDAQSAGFSAGGKLCRARCAVLSMDGKGRVYTYYIGEPSQSSLRDASSPEGGALFALTGRWQKAPPFGGAVKAAGFD